MKRKALFLLLFCLIFSWGSGNIFAQKKSVVHLGVFYPLSTNGKEAKEYTNIFSFHLLYGVSHSERAFIFSGLANSIEADANGIQFSGLFNVIGGGSNGLTFAGLSNITGGNARGVQFSGLGNISEKLTGLQFGGLANIAQDVNGFQFSGLGNIGQDIKGGQFGGLLNISENFIGFQMGGLGNIGKNIKGVQFSGLGNISDGMNGAQMAGLANVADDVSGFQVGGIANVAGNISGLQFGGICNVSGNMKGVQLSGMGNIAGNIKGLQMSGIYNRAGNVDGVQLSGIVNIANKSDYPIGLVNIIKYGEKGIGVTLDELQNLIGTFRSGGRVLYGIVGAGYSFKPSENLLALEGGFGAHINCSSKFRINTELASTCMTDFNGNVAFKNAFRILPAYQISPAMEIFAGPSLNYMQTNDAEIMDLFPGHSLWKDTDTPGEREQLFLGYTLGIQYFF